MGYDAKNIEVVEGLEHIWLRPGNYIGGTGTDGLHHLIWEAIDNSVDEYLGGFATNIIVELGEDDHGRFVEVSDDGRGIPTDKFGDGKYKGVSAATVAVSVLQAGGKFGGGGYQKPTGGLHGIGLKAANAMSDRFEMRIVRDGDRWEQIFVRKGDGAGGTPKSAIRKIGKSKDAGTTIRFYPVFARFKNDAGEPLSGFDPTIVAERLQRYAWTNPGLKLVFRTDDTETVFVSENGFADMIEETLPDLLIDPIRLIGTVETNDVSVDVDVSLGWSKQGMPEQILGFANSVETVDGGKHVAGFRSALTRTLNSWGREHDILKTRDPNPTGADVRTGMLAAVSVRLPDPEFAGQTKGVLNNLEAGTAVETFMNEHFGRWLNEHPTIAETICANIRQIMLTRAGGKDAQAAQKAVDNVRGKGLRRNNLLSDKLLAAKYGRKQAVKFGGNELVLVEGDSAGGTAESGRDPNIQAIFPLRGKLLNVEKASSKAFLSNKLIQELIAVLGCGFNASFDIDKLNYDRVLILCDADVDGGHIEALLLTMFYRFMPELVEGGHVYMALPPLFSTTVGSQKVYLRDWEARRQHEQDHPKHSQPYQYMKGLGEMDAHELSETTLDPATRRILQVSVADAAAVDRMLSKLMGGDAIQRRTWYPTYAEDVVDPVLVEMGRDELVGEKFSSEMTQIFQRSFYNYMKYVLEERAIASMCDGFKPVHRRVLWEIVDGVKATPNKPHVKCSKVTGATIGRSHPHGDSSVYDALARLAQPFSQKVVAADWHGNYGTAHLAPAAARYTEVRASQYLMELCRNADSETKWTATYDGSGRIPEVLPSVLPNVLINGVSKGIAVGWTAGIPSHNPAEVVKAVKYVIDNSGARLGSVLKRMPGPDLPMPTVVTNRKDLEHIYRTGEGSLTMRGTYHIEQAGKKRLFVVDGLPYSGGSWVSAQNFIESVYQAADNGQLVGVSGVQNESAKGGVRVVLELEDGVDDVRLRDLLAKTTMFGTTTPWANYLLDEKGIPRLFNLLELIEEWIGFRMGCVRRRSETRIRIIGERIFLLDGLIVCLVDIEKTVRLIRSAKTRSEASTFLCDTYNINGIQADFVLNRSLGSLTSLQIEELRQELEELREERNQLETLLADDDRVRKQVGTEMVEASKRLKLGDVERVTSLEDEVWSANPISVTAPTRSTVIVDSEGYVKVGVSKDSQTSKIGTQMFEMMSDQQLLFFGSDGTMFRAAPGDLIDGPIVLSSRWSANVRLVATILDNGNSHGDEKVVMVASNGKIKQIALTDLAGGDRAGGIKTIKLADDEQLITAFPANRSTDPATDQSMDPATDKSTDIVLVADDTKAIRFGLDEVSTQGRQAAGVTGLKTSTKTVDVWTIINNKPTLKSAPPASTKIVATMKKQGRGGKGIKTKPTKK